MRAKSIKGFPVVSLEDGSMIGKLHDLLVDPAGKKVEALLVGEKGFLKGRSQYIPYSRVGNIGKDVITVEPEKELVTTDVQAHLESLRNYSFLGNNVISQDGDYLARVQDYTFHPQSGEIESLLLYDFRDEEKKGVKMMLKMEGVLNLGRDYIIARSGYGDYLEELSTWDEPFEEKDAPPEKEINFEREQERREIPASDIFDRVKDALNAMDREITREGKVLARETRDKMKKYVLGKKANYTVKDKQGHALVQAGEIIDEDIIRIAEAQEKVGTLFLSAISQEVEDSLETIGNKISSFFRG